MLRGLAVGGFVAEDGGEDPEVVGALGPEEMVGKDGRDAVVDYGGEDGYGGVRVGGWRRRLGSGMLDRPEGKVVGCARV